MDLWGLFAQCSAPETVRQYVFEDDLHLELKSAWPTSGRGGDELAVGAGLRLADVNRAMASAAGSVRPFPEGRFGTARRLQDACGNYGHVDVRPSLDRGEDVAVKSMPNSWVTSSHEAFEARNPGAAELPWLDLGLLWELNRLSYPYANELLGVFRDQERTYVVTSLATQGDLFAWRAQEPRPGVEREALLLPIMQQVFDAVRALHDLGIAHRDLSLENILLTDGGDDAVPKVKLIDFAMATLARRCVDEPRGKVVYRAPEMHLRDAYDPFLSDAFALGVVLFAAACRDYPWSSTRPGACRSFELVVARGLPAFLEQRRVRGAGAEGQVLAEVLSPELVELLEGLLEPLPARRWNLGEARLWGGDQGQPSALDCLWLQEGGACGPVGNMTGKHSESSASSVSTDAPASEDLNVPLEVAPYAPLSSAAARVAEGAPFIIL